MSRFPCTPEFIEYSREAGRDLSEVDDGWVLATFGGEIRLYLRCASDAFVLTEAQRSEPESFVMSASDIADIERYMTAYMGSIIRSGRGYWFVYTPWDEKDLAPGWTVVVDLDNRWHLSDPAGRVRAIFSGDRAVEFSWIANASLADIRDSYLDPGGAPLFAEERWRTIWK